LIPLRQPGVVASPDQMRLLQHALAGNIWDPPRLRTHAYPADSRKLLRKVDGAAQKLLVCAARHIRFARLRNVLLISDSCVTVHIVQNWASRSLRLLAQFRTLRALCEAHGVTLSTKHLPSVLNFWADCLSRRRDTASWRLPPTAQLLLQQRFRTQLLDGQGLPRLALTGADSWRWFCRGQPSFPSDTGTLPPCGEAYSVRNGLLRRGTKPPIALRI
jgi:hypothetical protein